MPKFKLGQVVTTSGIAEALPQAEILGFIKRHAAGDWGDVCDEDREENEISLKNGCRVLSQYTSSKGRIWVITEADRSVTTVLFPHEY